MSEQPANYGRPEILSDSFSVRLLSVTPDAEKTLVYCARVSSPNQDNPDYAGLLRYLIAHRHWSPFEMASATLEIVTSRMVSAQILRHRSFSFQEWSTRYSEVEKHIKYRARRQDIKNRQSSIDDISDSIQAQWQAIQDENWRRSVQDYKWAIHNGIARECARAVLPLQTQTKLYMAGTLRSWIHYFEVRCHPDTQAEHRDVALAARALLAQHLPHTAEALKWT